MGNKSVPITSMISTHGTVIAIKKKWQLGRETVVVKYEVEGHSYIKEEIVQYHKAGYFLRFVKMKDNSGRLLGNIKTGDSVRVHYAEHNPASSYLPDNTHWV